MVLIAKGQRAARGSSARVLAGKLKVSAEKLKVSSRQRPAAGSGARDGNRRHGNRGAGQEPVPVGAGVRPVSGQPQLSELSGSERGPEGETLHQLPEVPAVLEGARIRQVPQVSSLPAHAGAAAVRTLQEGAG